MQKRSNLSEEWVQSLLVLSLRVFLSVCRKTANNIQQSLHRPTTSTLPRRVGTNILNTNYPTYDEPSRDSTFKNDSNRYKYRNHGARGPQTPSFVPRVA
ncbi:hypothetical protein CEXT_278411 [Caerostris extrusa]|uniref:Uncharacterized protein n=1 Tax=Caerostris extrusa TaxID=172846 RepID=A0AAV4S5K3_CAEEX|nr:hypothetical protein CEXT_278411 [Caerostris extrusa]